MAQAEGAMGGECMKVCHPVTQKLRVHTNPSKSPHSSDSRNSPNPKPDCNQNHCATPILDPVALTKVGFSQCDGWVALCTQRWSCCSCCTDNQLYDAGVALLTFIRQSIHDVAALKTNATEYTRYDATDVPGIGIGCYLHRMMHYMSISPACLLIAGVYMRRIKPLIGGITPYNVHRLIAGTICCAVKYHEDNPLDLKQFAEICGITFDKRISSRNTQLQMRMREVQIPPQHIKRFTVEELDVREEQALRLLDSYSVQEIERIEVATLEYLDWRLWVRPEEVASFEAEMACYRGAEN